MKKLFNALLDYFTLNVNTSSYFGTISTIPAGITPDPVGFSGLIGLIANIDAIDWDLFALVGASSTSITLTGSQFFVNIIDYSGSPGGGVTLTTPTALQIIAAMPASIPNIYNFPWEFINDASGQTVTLTAGTGVTINGTATIANNTVREFLVSVNVLAGTVFIRNKGSKTL